MRRRHDISFGSGNKTSITSRRRITSKRSANELGMPKRRGMRSTHMTCPHYDGCNIRFVESPDAAAAENAAVQMIRETQRLRDVVRNGSDDPPVMDVIGITEMESFDGIDNLEPGFVLYGERPKRWWQFWRR